MDVTHRGWNSLEIFRHLASGVPVTPSTSSDTTDSRDVPRTRPSATNTSFPMPYDDGHKESQLMVASRVTLPSASPS